MPDEWPDLFETDEERDAFIAAAKGRHPADPDLTKAMQRCLGERFPYILRDIPLGTIAEAIAEVAAQHYGTPLTTAERADAAAMLRAYKRKCGDFENPLILAEELADKLDSTGTENERKRTPPSTPAPGYKNLPLGWRPERTRHA
jgi:hypothetical protein